MRQTTEVYPDIEFEEYDPVTAAIEDPEIEVPRFTVGNMKWEMGRNEVRFFPKRKGIPLFVQVAEHWINTRDNKRARFACAAAHLSERCAVCEKAEQLMFAGMAEQAKDLAAQVKYYALVIDMKRPSFGLQMAQIPWSVYTALVGTKENPDSGMTAMYGDFASKDAGYPVFVMKTEKNKKIGYTAMPNISEQGPFDMSLLGGKPIPNIANDKLTFQPFEEVALAVSHIAPAANRAAIGARPAPRNLPR